jgi:hypothetical protein
MGGVPAAGFPRPGMYCWCSHYRPGKHLWNIRSSFPGACALFIPAKVELIRCGIKLPSTPSCLPAKTCVSGHLRYIHA